MLLHGGSLLLKHELNQLKTQVSTLTKCVETGKS